MSLRLTDTPLELVSYKFRVKEREKLLLFSFPLPCLIFQYCLFNSAYQRFQGILDLSLPAFRVLSWWQPKHVPWQILSPGNVDTDSGDILCQDFQSFFSSQKTCSWGLWRCWFPRGHVYSSLLSGGLTLLRGAASESPLSLIVWDWDTYVHLERSRERASFSLGSSTG